MSRTSFLPKWHAVLGMLALVVMAGCADQPESPLAPSTPSNSAAAVDPEKAALSELTRVVALALQDAGLRHRVKNDMRASLFTHEHKLEFRSYLQGSSGGILLAKMAQASGRSREELLTLIASVRPLEFYMPVVEHRESWRGGDNLIVASLLEDHTVPMGFTLKGEPVALDAEAVPVTPTLGLVPVETDFSRPLDVRRVKNGNDQNGQAIGTYENECMQPLGTREATIQCSGGGGEFPSSGLYMTYSYLKNDGEGWMKASPEIEVHVQAATASSPNEGKDLACSSESGSGARYFDQNGSTWSGSVLVFTQSQIDEQKLSGKEGFHVTFWEDDDGRCQLKTDKNIQLIMANAATYYGANAAKAVAPVCPQCSAAITAVTLTLSAYAWASWLLSNDDFLGVWTPGSGVIVNDDGNNGSATMQLL